MAPFLSTITSPASASRNDDFSRASEVNVYQVGGVTYKSYTFTETGSFYLRTSRSFDILIVANGGNGQSTAGGGGGEVVVKTDYKLSRGTYNFSIGSRGELEIENASGTRGKDFIIKTEGNNELTDLRALGGGNGGQDGGSGGGGYADQGSSPGNLKPRGVSIAVNGLGFNGGSPTNTRGRCENAAGCGGGGAGGTGLTNIRNSSRLAVGGAGGPCITNTFRDGTSRSYAGGGGGASNPCHNDATNVGGAGGCGSLSGGQGGGAGTIFPYNSVDGTGGGGGAQAQGSTGDGYGATGILVIREIIG
jgi:hypothetical protein